ncbi:uncharacterized protein LOC131648896 [Vicia villosa]|uniref:uncharacterized protein LOC131648896 n=1 Tax=Vicia villosa TaxID=3911 RepID=UPI00273BC4BC|nr:uncharacterized protein LOC131648896 [Vicia villosa]
MQIMQQMQQQQQEYGERNERRIAILTKDTGNLSVRMDNFHEIIRHVSVPGYEGLGRSRGRARGRGQKYSPRCPLFLFSPYYKTLRVMSDLSVEEETLSFFNLYSNSNDDDDIIWKSINDDDVHMSGGDAHMAGDDVHIPGDNVHMAEEEENDDDVQKDDDNADVTQDVNDNTKAGPEAAAGTNVVNLDDMFDSDLVANGNPSIVKRLMTRKGIRILIKVLPRGRLFLKAPLLALPRGEQFLKVLLQSWSKVVPKKKKPKVITNYESDVAVDVQDIPLRKKPTTSKLVASVPEKRLALERELAHNALECKEIMDLIHEAGFMKIVTHFSKCYEMLVKEFIVNLSEVCADRKSKDFRKVYVRGKCVTFSSTIIKNYLGRYDEAQPEMEVFDNKVCQVITAKQVKSWLLKGKLSASKLSIKYDMLHKIGAVKWVPTNQKSTNGIVLGKFIYAVGTKTKFDYGSYIFDQTMKHAGSFSVKGPIAFPSLICGIILNQYPSILSENDSICKRESTLSFHYELFQGTHVPDIVMTSAETSKGSPNASKAEVIAMLKETCQELETRKLTLEKLISSLEMDEDAEEQAEEDEQDGVGDEREAGSDTNPDEGTDEEADGDGSSGSESDD